MNQEIKIYFQTKGICVPDDWIDQCIKFLNQEYGDKLNTWQIKDKAYNQWLNTDLTDLGSSCLPLGLREIKTTFIKGKFILQINKLHDIGVSSYKQNQLLKKEENENDNIFVEKTYQNSWQPSSSRMLMFKMTDGTSDVSGIEYETISSISLSMAPGSKIILEGDIEVRRGVMLLKEKYIKILGGEVESFCIPHSQDNVLRRVLGLEETEIPITFKGWSLHSEKNKNEPVKPCDGWSKKPPSNIKKEPVKNFDGWSQKPSSNIIKDQKNIPITSFMKTIKSSPAILEDDFDDLLDGDLETALMEVENSHVDQKSNIRQEISSSNNSWLKRTDNYAKKPKLQNYSSSASSNISKFDNSINNNSQCMKFNNMPSQLKSRGTNQFGTSIKPIKNEIFENSDDEEALFLAAEEFDDIISEKPKSNVTSGSQIASIFSKSKNEKYSCFRNDKNLSQAQKIVPFQYLNSMPSTVHMKMNYTIKAFVMTLLSKLKQQNGSHFLTVMLNDGTGSCVVNIHDNVLTEILGLNSNELAKQIVDRNPTSRAALTEKMNSFQKSLISMSCLFNLELSPGEARPTVIQITLPDASHLKQLKRRLK